MEIKTTEITPLGSILSVLALIVWVLGYNLWHVFGVYVYDLSISITILFLVTAIYLSAVGWHKRFSLAFVLFTASNVVDEVWFDPTQVNYNEYVAAGFIFVTMIFYKHIRHYYLYLSNVRKRKGNHRNTA